MITDFIADPGPVPEFIPILTRQRDHARDHGQADRAALFDGLIQHAGTGPATTERS